jgi:hypothetical protein
LDLAELTGTHVEGTLRVSAAALNELLNLEGSRLRGATVEVRSDNEVVVRHGVVRATMTLPHAVEVGSSPRATLSMASVMVALALKALLRQPYVQVHGRHLTIHLAEVPALRSLRTVWPHVRRVEVATEREGVRLRVVFTVTGGIDA